MSKKSKDKTAAKRGKDDLMGGIMDIMMKDMYKEGDDNLKNLSTVKSPSRIINFNCSINIVYLSNNIFYRL